jgi:hypothetical protein
LVRIPIPEKLFLWQRWESIQPNELLAIQERIMQKKMEKNVNICIFKKEGERKKLMKCDYSQKD